MKREKLQEMLKDIITDETKRKEVIDDIMKQNGDDINKAKGDLETIKTEKANLEKELETANTTISDLKKNNSDNEALQTKIKEHEGTIKNLKAEHTKELTRLTREGFNTEILSKYKAKNNKAVMALIDAIETDDNEAYKMLFEKAVKGLAESEDTKFMFGEAQVQTHYNPQGGGNPEAKGYGASMAERRNTTQAQAYDPWGAK